MEIYSDDFSNIFLTIKCFLWGFLKYFTVITWYVLYFFLPQWPLRHVEVLWWDIVERGLVKMLMELEILARLCALIWKYRIPILNKSIWRNAQSCYSIRLWRQRVQSGSIYLKIHFFLARLAKTVSGIYLLHIDPIYKILLLDTQYAFL